MLTNHSTTFHKHVMTNFTFQQLHTPPAAARDNVCSNCVFKCWILMTSYDVMHIPDIPCLLLGEITVYVVLWSYNSYSYGAFTTRYTHSSCLSTNISIVTTSYAAMNQMHRRQRCPGQQLGKSITANTESLPIFFLQHEKLLNTHITDVSRQIALSVNSPINKCN